MEGSATEQDFLLWTGSERLGRRLERPLGHSALHCGHLGFKPLIRLSPSPSPPPSAHKTKRLERSVPSLPFPGDPFLPFGASPLFCPVRHLAGPPGKPSFLIRDRRLWGRGREKPKGSTCHQKPPRAQAWCPLPGCFLHPPVPHRTPTFRH